MRATTSADYDDYPELYARWFEYGDVSADLSARMAAATSNEVWSYGKQAEPILEKYLRLRYQLMPYIYSLGYWTRMRRARRLCGRCSWIFGSDPKVAELGDEYMFGPALLVAPVTEQGATSREVYLPAGTDWYNYWTNERVHGGQRLRVVRRSIRFRCLCARVRSCRWERRWRARMRSRRLPRCECIRARMGLHALQRRWQDLCVREGKSEITHLHWDDASGKLTHTGAAAWSAPDAEVVKVVR